MEETFDYRIALDAFEGPLDLLLYLIKKNEVDIYDIPIATITGQFLEQIQGIADLDVNQAGEFLVMASNLMEIKSRIILPRGEGAEEEEEDDPRRELVRQLLEYRKYREAAEALKDRADREGLSYPRGSFDRPAGVEVEEGEIELDLWQLVRAFAGILDDTGTSNERRIHYTERPVAEFVAELRERLRQQRRFNFRSLFPVRPHRGDLIGMFLAILELIKQREVMVLQLETHGDIEIAAREESP